MDVLTLNGKRYVKASRAAKDLGYASDYVGQLCRNGSVDAHLVGRTWYVNPDTLGAHRVEKKRISRTKAREYAKKAIDETRSLQIANTEKSYKNIAIHYNVDRAGLIPEVQKVGIVSEVTKVESLNDRVDDEPGYTLVNSDKKILMSGTIPVHDAEEEVVYSDVTILTPKIVRKRKIEESARRPIVLESGQTETSEEQGVEEESGQEKNTPRITFSDRISLISLGESPETTPDTKQGESKNKHFSRMGICIEIVSICIVLLSVLSVFLELRATYTYPNKGGINVTISTENVRDFLKKY